MTAEHEDSGFERAVGDNFGCQDTIDIGHLHIHEHDIGQQ